MNLLSNQQQQGGQKGQNSKGRETIKETSKYFPILEHTCREMYQLRAEPRNIMGVEVERGAHDRDWKANVQ